MATRFNPFLFLVYTLDELSFWLFFNHFWFILLIFEYFKQVVQPIAIHSLPIAGVIQKETTPELVVSACWKQENLRTQSWSPRTAQFREERWMYKGAAMSSIPSLNNGSMATRAHWSHVEWQNLQSLFFTQAFAEASHLKETHPQRPHRVCLPQQSHTFWETATLTCCYTYLFPGSLLSILHAIAPCEGEEGHQQLWKKKSTTIYYTRALYLEMETTFLLKIASLMCKISMILTYFSWLKW